MSSDGFVDRKSLTELCFGICPSTDSLCNISAQCDPTQAPSLPLECLYGESAHFVIYRIGTVR